MATGTESDTGHKALVDEIASAIRNRIMTGEIAIGSQLRQAELAQELGVSRTPVREALRQLQTSGLIDVLPNRGAVVRVPAPWEVREAYEVRAELEGLACERAVGREHQTGFAHVHDLENLGGVDALRTRCGVEHAERCVSSSDLVDRSLVVDVSDALDP